MKNLILIIGLLFTIGSVAQNGRPSKHNNGVVQADTPYPASPVESWLKYDFTTKTYRFFNGTSWGDVGSISSSTVAESIIPLSVAPSGASEGDVYFDTTNDTIYAYDGASWNAVGSGGGEVNTVDFYPGISSGLTKTQWTTANNTKRLFDFDGDNGELEFHDPGSSTWNVLAKQQWTESNFLKKDNTTAFTPTLDYHPATKKYVDDNVGGGSSFAEWALSTGTRLGGDLTLKLGDYDNLNGGTQISLDDSPGTLDLIANQVILNSVDAIEMPLVSIAQIDAKGSKALITKEYFDANIPPNDAAEVVFDNSETDLTSTDVESAIKEVYASVPIISNSISRQDVSTSVSISQQNVEDGLLFENTSGANTLTINAMSLDYTNDQVWFISVKNSDNANALTVTDGVGVTFTEYVTTSTEPFVLYSTQDDVWEIYKNPTVTSSQQSFTYDNIEAPATYTVTSTDVENKVIYTTTDDSIIELPDNITVNAGETVFLNIKHDGANDCVARPINGGDQFTVTGPSLAFTLYSKTTGIWNLYDGTGVTTSTYTPPVGAPVVETSAATITTGDTTTLVATAPTGIVDDDILLMLVTVDHGGTDADPTSAGFTLLTGTKDVTNSKQSYVLWKRASTESGNYTVNWTGSEQAIVQILRISGALSTADPFDVVGTITSAASATTITPADITSTEVNTLAIAYGVVDTFQFNGNISGTGWSIVTNDEVDTGGVGAIIVEKAQATIGSVGSPTLGDVPTSEGVTGQIINIKSD